MNKILLYFLITAPLLTLSLHTYNYYKKPKHSSEHIIKAIMNYEMPHVIARCQKDYNYSNEDMLILEKELKRYLALSTIKPNDGTGMFSGDVDNLWHSFILFTHEYADFCHKHIGFFVHHIPELDRENKTLKQREEARKDFQAFIKNYEEAFGEEIHPIWFLDMC